MKYSAKEEQQLMTEILDPMLKDNINDFMQFAYPWGKPNTPLADFKGPRGWQRELNDEISHHIKENRNLIIIDDVPKVFYEAIASGRGIGKSAEFGMLDHWFMSTRIGATSITTANTEGQLKSRTWPEYSKWYALAINGHWFDPTATAIRPQKWFAQLVKEDLNIDTGYYYSQAQAWSEENPDAFAGVHNPHGIFVKFDEASGIPLPIWNVTEGFYTEPVADRFWIVFSNPRRNTGAFFECFHKNRDQWNTRNIDGRDVEGTDKALYQRLIDKNGEDSDVARIEVKGQFPHQGSNQFNSREVVRKAQEREVVPDPFAPLIMSVDVARFGDDTTVIGFRQGRDARSFPKFRLKGWDNMQVANKCAELIDTYNPDAVNIDAGNGTGVIDRLREMGYKVNEIWFGSKPNDTETEYFNMRTSMWGLMRDWLGGGCIPDDQRLEDDLLGPEYQFAGRDGDKIMLEPKESMKKRGLASPDDGDQLALTFAVKVARKNLHTARGNRRNRVARDVDYDIFG
jgi:hypothetical protein